MTENNAAKPVLTDDEIQDIEASAEFSWCVPRAIEQAVLSKLRAEGVQAGDERAAYTDPLSDFQEGQWWVKELDALAQAVGATHDQKRAVAVVHHMLRAAALASAPVGDKCLCWPSDEHGALCHKDCPIHGEGMASAPVAGEAVAWRVTHPRSPKPGWEDAAREQPPTLENVKQQDPDLVLELSYAAPQASEAVCSCPTGDGSLRHPCAVHPPRPADKDGGDCAKGAGDLLAPVFQFLLGEGPLRGVHFGDRHPDERGAYWWRKDLRAALSPTQPTEQGER